MFLKMITAVMAFFVASLTFAATSDQHDEALIERIKPVGEVCVAGDDCAVAAAPAESSGPMSGEQVYNKSCMACHGSGVAGAPKLGDAATWSPRAAKGMDALMTSALNGIGAMPPKGTCGSCSDDEIQAAIEYMLENSK